MSGGEQALRQARAEHQTLVIRYSADLYYASCLCGWHTPTDLFETVDLLRAMHAHEVTFASRS